MGDELAAPHACVAPRSAASNVPLRTLCAVDRLAEVASTDGAHRFAVSKRWTWQTALAGPQPQESTRWRPVFPGQSGSASGEPRCCAQGMHRLDVASCDRLVFLSSQILLVTSPQYHVTCSSGNVRSSLPCCGRSKHVNRSDGMVAMPLAVPCAHSVVEQERAPPVGIFYCFSTFS